jgi:glycosyltransferase involved in cell wall biosynthesis
MLRRLLQALQAQQVADRVVSVVVADNDAARSAENVVREYSASSALAVTYVCEPRQNISHARNAALRQARGAFIAFIDDDEFPADGWLTALLETCKSYGADGVLGPVLPHFDEPPPQWIIDGRFCERPEHPTGRIMSWEECRTGNLLLRRSLVEGLAEPFDPVFGTGGEDKDFFLRMTQAGRVFRWCNEGRVYETVPRERWTRRYMLKRALLRGSNIVKQPVGRLKHIARSIVATPAYLIMLPFTLVLGHHVFMKYCIKLCDHSGRLLALLRLNPVRER